MRTLFLGLFVAGVMVGSAHADCYDSGTVFDGRGSYGEGTLCRFGDEEAPVLPYYQKRRESYTDYLFTDREQMAMLKGLVRQDRSGGQGRLDQAVASSTRPTRTYRYRSLLGGMGGGF
jgi:hypothetical protein